MSDIKTIEVTKGAMKAVVKIDDVPNWNKMGWKTSKQREAIEPVSNHAQVKHGLFSLFKRR